MFGGFRGSFDQLYLKHIQHVPKSHQGVALHVPLGSLQGGWKYTKDMVEHAQLPLCSPTVYFP